MGKHYSLYSLYNLNLALTRTQHAKWENFSSTKLHLEIILEYTFLHPDIKYSDNDQRYLLNCEYH